MSTPKHIFRAGTHTTADGQSIPFSLADVAAIAANYNPALHEAPITIGHPENDKPAYGWVDSLRAEGGELYAKEKQVEPQFADMRAAGRFKKISVALYDKTDPLNPTPGQYYLRHVTYLGAMPPAIKGLRNFSAAEGGIHFEFSETTKRATMTDEEIQALREQAAEAKRLKDEAEAKAAAAEKQADALRTQVQAAAEATKQANHAAHVQFAEAHVKTGQVLPKDVQPLAAVLDALSGTDGKPVQISFNEGATTKQVDPATWLKEFIAAAKPQIHFGEHKGAGENLHDQLPPGASDKDVDAAAKQLAKAQGITYNEALTRVIAS